MCLNLAWNVPGSACRANASTDQAVLEAWAEALHEHDPLEQPISKGKDKNAEDASEQ